MQRVARDRERRVRRVAESRRSRRRAGHERHRVLRPFVHRRSVRAHCSPKPAPMTEILIAKCDPQADRGHAPQLAVPARPPDRRVRADPQPLPRRVSRTHMTDRFPAEWEPHDATWIAWPHHEPDWPGKLGPIPWVYAEIVRVLAAARARRDPLSRRRREAPRPSAHLDAHGVDDERPPARRAERSRVAARLRRRPASSTTTGAVALVNWALQRVGEVRQLRARRRRSARPSSASRGCRASSRVRPDTGERVVLEGGGIETDGAGHDARHRRVAAVATCRCAIPGLTREGYERVFRDAPRHSPDHLARRRLRRRRHARPHRRHRALRRAGRRSCSRTRKIRPTTRTIAARWTTAAPRSSPARRDGALRRREAAVSARRR